MLNSNVKGYACHLSLCWASSIQSILPHPISWRSILMLSSHLHLGLPSGLFPSSFPTKTLYTPLLSRLHATCPSSLILLNFINPNSVVWAVQIVNPQQYSDNYLSDIFWCGGALCPIPECVCVCVCARARVCVRACVLCVCGVCACVWCVLCVRARARVCVCVCVWRKTFVWSSRFQGR